ncbi:hypothetical protein KCP75_20840 [Salmonella enterica subsp. enterica]|nr:hypothetical protein KCP75_20840 [Salmonella enterica subsp. enterica]
MLNVCRISAATNPRGCHRNVRLAVNAGEFIAGGGLRWYQFCPVRVISGEEARLIYQGSLIPPAAQISDWWWISAAPAQAGYRHWRANHVAV